MNAEQLIDLSKARSLLRSGSARSIRKASGLSIREVAGVLQVTPASVSRWETGSRIPRGQAAVRYAELLNGLLRRSMA